MARGRSIWLCWGLCLALGSCNSGPASSGSSGSASSGKDKAATLGRKAEHIEGLLARRGVAAAVLDDLMSALPDRAWLTEVTYAAGKVQAKGKAPSNNLVAAYLSRLEGSPSLTNVTLRSSAMKIVKGRELQEFALEAVARDVERTSAPLEELEKALPARLADAEMLRDLQRLTLDAGLQMTKFAPGAEISGEFTTEWPVAIEVSGDQSELGRYLKSLSELPRLWVVDKLAFKAVSADDPRSPVRASITARTYFAP